MSDGARRAGAAALALAGVLLGGCFEAEVVRVVDGRAWPGDFVAPEAYSAYARAAIAEREGRLEDAARGYAAAADDSGDPAAHARLGATLCALGREDAARAAFAEGLARDPAAAVVLRERARCALGRGALAEATSSAERAVRLSPRDRESLAVLRTALVRAGRTDEAEALADEAHAEHAPISTRGADAPPVPPPTPLPASVAAPGVDLTPSLRADRPDRALVDVHLARGELAAAARVATVARLGRADLAARALAHGHRAWAQENALRVLRADPGDATAWCVAVASAADLSEEQALRRLRALPAAPPSELATLLYAELLLRRAGPDAALAWVPHSALDRSRDDPLAERARVRLRAAIPAP